MTCSNSVAVTLSGGFGQRSRLISWNETNQPTISSQKKHFSAVTRTGDAADAIVYNFQSSILHCLSYANAIAARDLCFW